MTIRVRVSLHKKDKLHKDSFAQKLYAETKKQEPT